MTALYPDGVKEFSNIDNDRIIKCYPNNAMTFNGKIFHWSLDLKNNLATANFIKGGKVLLTEEETEFILSPSSR